MTSKPTAIQPDCRPPAARRPARWSDGEASAAAPVVGPTDETVSIERAPLPATTVATLEFRWRPAGQLELGRIAGRSRPTEGRGRSSS